MGHGNGIWFVVVVVIVVVVVVIQSVMFVYMNKVIRRGRRVELLSLTTRQNEFCFGFVRTEVTLEASFSTRRKFFT